MFIVSNPRIPKFLSHHENSLENKILDEIKNGREIESILVTLLL